jgi:hypothetical protein
MRRQTSFFLLVCVVLASPAAAAVLRTGIVVRGSTIGATIQCIASNVSTKDVLIHAIELRSDSGLLVTALPSTTLGAGRSITVVSGANNYGRCVFDFVGGKSAVRALACAGANPIERCETILEAR